ncbi:pirin [Brevibacillus fluminis]|uniref:Pirin n=1 Tax=Brevibacillus fluminis TaxID=511487 RepID=A0A3M8DNS1_9BACL|nr:pirin family protein [Brevibacillus fluminis]RNB89733.1 pirin [Brevibacillus fluminis]
MTIHIFPPTHQGSGEFDGGAIIEQKPIGFSGEGSAVTRIGPLFYWAWGTAPQEGFIPSHPHQAFEIMTYVLQGKALHGDSLGTDSTVGAGGAQVIQAGSGVYHNERIVGPDAEIFQIWFEPNVREALQRKPTYNQYEHEQFPLTQKDGTTVKAVIGEEAPIKLVADARMWDVTIADGSQFTVPVGANRSIAVLAYRGDGSLRTASGEAASFSHKDFVVMMGMQDDVITLSPENGQTLSLAIIDVPTDPGYSLYPKRP